MALSKNIRSKQLDRISRNPLVGSSSLRKIFNKGKEKFTTRIESIVDIDEQLDRFGKNHVSLVKPEILYATDSFFDEKSRLYQHYREESISVIKEDDFELLSLITPESYRKIQNETLVRIHSGLIIVGIKGLTRKGLPAKTFVCILDTRHNNEQQAIIASMEIDMTKNNGIVYCTPDFMMNTEEFYKHIKIGIKTKGYDMIKSDNLLVCVGFVRKLTNSSRTKYKLDFVETKNILGSKGIQCIEATQYSPEINAGLEWKLGSFSQNQTLAPTRNLMYEDEKGRLSIRFGGYERTNGQIEDAEEVESINMVYELENFTVYDCKELLDKEYERLGNNDYAEKELGRLYRLEVLDDIINEKIDPREIFHSKDPRSPNYKIESAKMQT